MMTRRTFAAIIAGAIVLTACGADDAAAPVGTDGVAVTLPEPAAGPVPQLAVNAESVSNRLPDIAVRQINGEGGWVNLKNTTPADKPVLVWFWAPH